MVTGRTALEEILVLSIGSKLTGQGLLDNYLKAWIFSNEDNAYNYDAATRETSRNVWRLLNKRMVICNLRHIHANNLGREMVRPDEGDPSFDEPPRLRELLIL